VRSTNVEDREDGLWVGEESLSGEWTPAPDTSAKGLGTQASRIELSDQVPVPAGTRPLSTAETTELQETRRAIRKDGDAQARPRTSGSPCARLVPAPALALTRSLDRIDGSEVPGSVLLRRSSPR
jgi:hypothetical protein